LRAPGGLLLPGVFLHEHDFGIRLGQVHGRNFHQSDKQTKQFSLWGFTTEIREEFLCQTLLP
jgi:hypothetical protein